MDLTIDNTKALARAISVIENRTEGYETLLLNLSPNETKVIGITGPPGAGKSTLTNALIDTLVSQQKKIAVLCIDPSSPFTHGALLGDRIRMSEWYNNPNVFIRSLATRGSLGGLHPMIIEITDVMKSAGFDYVIIETVGVGQSEIEIVGLADVTVVVVVPESGDEIQTMKSGLMEIADVFVINKADRPDADSFEKNLRLMLAPAFQHQDHAIEIVKTIATTKDGIAELLKAITTILSKKNVSEKKAWLLTEKAFQLIQHFLTKDINKQTLYQEISSGKVTNIYRYLKEKNLY